VVTIYVLYSGHNQAMHNTELRRNLYIRLGVKMGRDLVLLTKLDKNLFRHYNVGETNAVY